MGRFAAGSSRGAAAARSLRRRALRRAHHVFGDQPRQIAPSAGLGAGEQHTIDLFRNASPSVVHVFAQPRVSRLRERFGSESEDEQQRQSGTGFVWDNAGHIVTNNHVVRARASDHVRLANGETVAGDAGRPRADYDLAVLRLGRVGRRRRRSPVGASADLKVGQAVFAIGNPFGLDQTLTTGIDQRAEAPSADRGRRRARRRYPDRRGDQSRQFRRAAARFSAGGSSA